MAGGWQVVPAFQMESQGQGGSMSNKMMDPSWTQKEEYKQQEGEEKLSMLPGQHMDFLMSDMAVNSQKRKIQGEMYQYVYKHGSMPPPDMQAQWNRQLTELNIAELKNKTNKGVYIQNFKDVNTMREKLLTDKNSTANNLALTEEGGRLVPMLDIRRGRFATQMNIVNAFDEVPGMVGGQPYRVNLDTPINYNGAFEKRMDDVFNEAAKSQTYEGTTRGASIEEGDNKWATIIMTHSNAGNINDAAKKLINGMEEDKQAWYDLNTMFYEDILSGGKHTDGLWHTRRQKLDDKGVLTFKQYTPEETKSIDNLLNGRKLSQQDKLNFDSMVRQFGADKIIENADIKIDKKQVVAHLKDVQTGKGKQTDELSMLVMGKLKAESTPNRVTLKNAGGALISDDKTPLRMWKINPMFLDGVNERIRKDLGIGGYDISNITNSESYYTDQGTPNSMGDLLASGAKLVQISGDVREFFVPLKVRTEKGDEYSSPDITDVSGKKGIPTTYGIHATVIIPHDKMSEFRGTVTEIDDKNITFKKGVSKDYFEKKASKLFSLDPKKAEEDYLMDIFIPLTPQELAGLSSIKSMWQNQVAAINNAIDNQGSGDDAYNIYSH